MDQSAVAEGVVVASDLSLQELCTKAAVAHTITYMFMGILASTLLHYREAFANPEVSCYMRQLNDPIVMAGPLFQPIRGILFGLAFYPIRGVLFGRKRGWLVMAWLLVALGILGTFGPAPASFEGMIFSTWPVLGQMGGWIEVVPQAVLLSAILCYWVNYREKKWLSWTLGSIFFVSMVLPLLGLMATKPAR